ncbi:GCN5-related N-acetyltransferase 4, chloroplastic-like isoform X3 [Phragmites australis]|uniref:GCN5-related N-acetyltransferase 4, chloroplastic-like isoform X3 n=1 Tax=Phragmites australis TaxID=29695 RepID=UPI002D79A82E|nr:GCN5-related N-acetyltransferase 4, chloroplastic-like isoform X3 [Phragmites australis]
MIPLALSLSRSPASSVFSLPLDGACRSAAAVRRHGPSFAYKPAAGICYASQAVELFPSLYPEIVVRDARLEDCWEVADTHCGSFFPDYKFPLDLVLRIDRYIALLSGFSVPPGCMRTCLVAVNSNSVNNSFSKCGDPRDARFQKYNLSRGSIAGILTVDTVADYLPRRGPLKQRRIRGENMCFITIDQFWRSKGLKMHRYCIYSKCCSPKGGTSKRNC